MILSGKGIKGCCQDTVKVSDREKIGLKRKKRGLLCVVLPALLLLSACGAGQEDEEQLIIVEQKPEGVEYSMAEATVGDVVRTAELKCEYRQLKDMEVCFEVSDRKVSRVYVKAGDEVKKGQILAELEIAEDAEERMRTLEYRIARNRLLITHLQEDEENEIAYLTTKYYADGSDSEEKKDKLEADIAALQQKNRYAREDYEDAITVDTLELEQIAQETAQCYLYAGMNGTVFYVKSNLEGSMSRAGERVVTLVDASECVFVSEDVEYRSYFDKETEVDVVVGRGKNAQTYRLIPYRQEEWGEELMFTFAEAADTTALEIGADGSIELVTGSREQVTKIPVEAVYTADGRSYVYVTGEGNTREVKWIETGFYGDEEVEVLAGLTAGEKVILK